jgi:hypothetical protein
MSEGKGTDDLGVFDELLKGKSGEAAADPNTSAAWKGGTLPPPPVAQPPSLRAAISI